MASYPEPRLNDNLSTSDKQHHNNKLLQPSSDTLDSDAEVIAENDFQLTKSQQRKLKKGSQTIPNSFPGITGESASGHSFRAASTIQQLPSKQLGSETEAKFSRLQDVVPNIRRTVPICFHFFRYNFGTRNTEASLF